MSVKEIFNGLIISNKIKEGMKPSDVYKLVESKLKKNLTSSQKQEVLDYLQQYIIKRVFDENKEKYTDVDDLESDFIDNDLIRLDKNNKPNKNDLKYLLNLFKEYENEEESEEEIKELEKNVKKLKLEERKSLPTKVNLKEQERKSLPTKVNLKEQERKSLPTKVNLKEQEIDEYEEELDEILKKIGILEWDTDDDYESKVDNLRIKSGINKKNLEKLIGKKITKKIDEFGVDISIRGNKLLVSYFNEDEGVYPPVDTLLTPKGILLDLYSVLVSLSELNREENEEERNELKEKEKEEKELEIKNKMKNILKVYEVEDLLKLAKEYASKCQYNELLKFKKDKLITYIIDILDLTYEQFENFLENIQEEVQKRTKFEKEVEKHLEEESFVDELKQYSLEELNDIVEQNYNQSTMPQYGKITKDKSKLINYIVKYIGPEYEYTEKKEIKEKEWVKQVYLPYERKIVPKLTDDEIISSALEQLHHFVNDKGRLPIDAKELDIYSNGEEEEEKEEKCGINNPSCENDKTCDLDNNICVNEKGVNIGKYKVIGSEQNLNKLREKLGITPIKLKEGTKIKEGEKLPIEKKELPPLEEKRKEEKKETLPPSPEKLYQQLQAIQGKEIEGSSKTKMDLDELKKQIASCLGLIE